MPSAPQPVPTLRMARRHPYRWTLRATHRARPNNSYQERGDFQHRMWPKAKFVNAGRMGGLTCTKV